MSAAAPFSPRRNLQVVVAVGRVTFQEILRDKVLYNILVCALLLMGMSLLAARLSFVRADRLMVNFGLTALSISCAMIGVFTGAAMLAREFDRRTVFVALARPVSRLQFVVGKYVGLAGVIVVNWLGLSALLAGLAALAVPGGLGAVATPILGAAAVLTLAQSLLLGALSVFFSTFSTTSLAVIFSLGLTLVGTNISQLRVLAAKTESAAFSELLRAACAVLPNLEFFSLGTQVTYGLPVDLVAFGGSLAYAFVFISLLMVAAGLLLRGREN